MLRIVGIFIMMLFLWSCANQTPPTGGPQDEEPPELITSSPKQGTVNFNGKVVTLEFSEDILVENYREQLIITPRIDQDFEVKYRKNRVTIEFEEPLPDSTTYTFNFRESIKDLNESNPAENLRIAFSTGSYLDSMYITGTVTNLLLDERMQDATISLYPAYDTLNPFEHPPVYFTKTNDRGQFSLENIKVGTYLLYTLNDKNNNLFINSQSEMYGYFPDTIRLNQSIDSVRLNMVQLDARYTELQSYRQNGTIFQIKYNKPIVNYDLFTSVPDTLVSNFSDKEQTTIQIFNTFPITDSLQTFINTEDSLNYQTMDTLYVKFEDTERSPSDFIIENQNMPTIITAKPQFLYELEFNKPINRINHDSLFVLLDSANIIQLDSSHLKFNHLKDEVTISYSLDPTLFEVPEPVQETKPTVKRDSSRVKPDTTAEKNNRPKPANIKPFFYAGPATFISIQSDSSNRLKKDLSFKKPEQLGTLFIEVNTNAPSFIVQLLNAQNKIIKESINQNQLTLKYLTPGDYRLRLLIDSNQNGHWDIGNPHTLTPPEPVIFYSGETEGPKITIRANWEVGPKIINYTVDN